MSISENHVSSTTVYIIVETIHDHQCHHHGQLIGMGSLVSLTSSVSLYSLSVCYTYDCYNLKEDMKITIVSIIVYLAIVSHFNQNSYVY